MNNVEVMTYSFDPGRGYASRHRSGYFKEIGLKVINLDLVAMSYKVDTSYTIYTKELQRITKIFKTKVFKYVPEEIPCIFYDSVIGNIIYRTKEPLITSTLTDSK